MTENFLYPEQFSHAHFQSISFPDSQPQGSHWSALCHYHVAFIRLSSISGICHVAFVFDCFQVQYHLWDYSCCICSLWLFIAEYYSIIWLSHNYLFINWWIFELFKILDNKAYYKHGCTNFCVNMFSVLLVECWGMKLG